MSIFLLLLLGSLVVLILFHLRRPIAYIISEQSRMVQFLKKTKGSQNPFLAGMYLFFGNAILFVTTLLFLYLLMYLFIPYVHLIIMVLAIIVSIYMWILISKSWSGTKKGRFQMAITGSSFYIFVCGLLVYWFITLKPTYPGEDIFMASIGLLIAILVASVAAVSCFIFTAYSMRN